MHGFGTTKWPDGRIYEGEYNNEVYRFLAIKMIKRRELGHLYGLTEENTLVNGRMENSMGKEHLQKLVVNPE